MAIAEVPFGVAAGAALGAFGGPAGVVAGAVVGSAVGAVLAIAHNRQMHRDQEVDDRLDADIGVIDGQIGAPNLKHPPATVGAYSAASSGSATDVRNYDAEGPFLLPDD